MEKGAEGNAPSAHAHKEDGQIAKFLARGEEILGTFTQSIRAFEGQTLNIKALTDSVAEIKKDLGRKRTGDSVDTGNGNSAKIAKKVETATTSADSEGAAQDLDDEIEEIMNPTETGEAEIEEDFFNDVTEFFAEESDTGEPVSEKVANLVNKSIRGQADEIKVTALKEKYKRPANVDNLQVAKVDRVLWEQLKWHTKGADAIRQKSVMRLHEGIIPLMHAMDHVANTKQADVGLLKTYISDAFKIMCNNVIKTNTERREHIKKELTPQYKSVCQTTSVSATGLFGDTLVEDAKKLDLRPVIMTTNSTGSKQPFLGKQGMSGPHYQHRRQYYPSYRRQNSRHFHRGNQYRGRGYQNQHQATQSGSYRSGKHSERSGMMQNKWEK